ncbi:phage holin family protein [Cellulomonas sp. PhB150]|uniref:phage holin family protein n=1 Tax=Cellulomonas sp. PhB150 TaxID=2485188 RepID=UPI000F49E0E1|nr:phage holin family protein [Cellulomonas sp. PhB150]ROS26038.1 superfamily IV 4 TMS phage holin [Cellulomonas sp. PhB150]
MVAFLIRALIFLLSAALGLWVASLVLDDFDLDWSGLLVAVVIFAVLQSVLAPWILRMARRYAGALTGAVGLISTFIALLITTLVSDGLSITGASTWLFGTLIVWLVTMLGALLLPLVLVRKGVEASRA